MLHALGLSFGGALAAAAINIVFGTLIAWTFVRYDFVGKRLFHALIDLPFALPTAVAGIALTALYADTGPIGGLLAKALGQVPIVGSSVEVNGVFLKADRLEGRRNRVSHIIAAAMPKEDTDLEDLLDDADSTQQGVPREQAK